VCTLMAIKVWWYLKFRKNCICIDYYKVGLTARNAWKCDRSRSVDDSDSEVRCVFYFHFANFMV
jgi:hypothetical protein